MDVDRNGYNWIAKLQHIVLEGGQLMPPDGLGIQNGADEMRVLILACVRNRLFESWSSVGAGSDFEAEFSGRCGRPSFVSKR